MLPASDDERDAREDAWDAWIEAHPEEFDAWIHELNAIGRELVDINELPDEPTIIVEVEPCQ